MNPVALDTLNTADRATFMAAIGEVMELAPWVADEAYAKRPFASIAALYQAMTDAVRNAGDERQRALIDGHPDLAGKAAREGKLTADSTAEQAAAGLDRLTEQEFATFHRLNDAYRTKFSMPFIVCARRHGKELILRQFEKRLTNDAASEQKTALGEIFRIAALRLDQRVTAPDRLKVHGHLSTHVLDTHGGHPAAGRGDRVVRGCGKRRDPPDQARRHQCGRPHRPAAVVRRAGPDRDLRIALRGQRLFRPSRARRWPIRRFSASCRSALRWRSRRAAITCRCRSRPGLTRLTEGAERNAIRVPGAAQHEVMRCRTGTVTNAASGIRRLFTARKNALVLPRRRRPSGV